MLDDVLRFVGVFFAMLFLLCLWLACASRSEEDVIAGINHRIWPEGHLTKTHLYVHWPAVYTQPKQHTHWKEPGGEEIVPAVTLKIPFEYLGQTAISFENAAKIARHDAGEKDIDDEAIDYYARIKTAVRVSDHQIVSIYLRFQPGAKPDVPPLIYNTDPPEVKQQKLEYLKDSYAVHIKRNQYYLKPVRVETSGIFGPFGFLESEGYFREADLDGLHRYVRMVCFDMTELHNRTSVKSRQRDYDFLAAKAADDHSPANCYEARFEQVLLTDVNGKTSPDKPMWIRCGFGVIGCDAYYGLKGREVINNFGIRTADDEWQKLKAISQAGKKPIFPLLDQSFTGLPQWREKVIPTQILLDSFILPEENPEVQGLFYKK